MKEYIDIKKKSSPRKRGTPLQEGTPAIQNRAYRIVTEEL